MWKSPTLWDIFFAKDSSLKICYYAKMIFEVEISFQNPDFGKVILLVVSNRIE